MIQLQFPHKYREEFWRHGRRNERFPSTPSDSTAAFEGSRSWRSTTCFPQKRYGPDRKSDDDFLDAWVTGTKWTCAFKNCRTMFNNNIKWGIGWLKKQHQHPEAVKGRSSPSLHFFPSRIRMSEHYETTTELWLTIRLANTGLLKTCCDGAWLVSFFVQWFWTETSQNKTILYYKFLLNYSTLSY